MCACACVVCGVVVWWCGGVVVWWCGGVVVWWCVLCAVVRWCGGAVVRPRPAGAKPQLDIEKYPIH